VAIFSLGAGLDGICVCIAVESTIKSIEKPIKAIKDPMKIIEEPLKKIAKDIDPE